MWLIADSGSTSTDWQLIDENGETIGEYSSPGINPSFLRQEKITEILSQSLRGKFNFAAIEEVYFFAAGNSSKRLQEITYEGLFKIFPHAKILSDHDLTACAYACYDGKPCICCILGTGSNSVYFDGISQREEVPSLAFILGDEASGVYYSKELLRAYFYKKLPIDLREAFEEAYGELDKDEVMRRVYEEERPNTYLATFMPFVVAHKHHPFLQRIIYKGIEEFIDIHVKCYPESADVEVHFVGSVATLLKEEILAVSKGMGISVGRFVKKPIKNLKSYIEVHRKRLLP